LDGENVCIFAYGSTGSGKTHTMQGSYNDSNSLNFKSGILPRTAYFIFDEITRLKFLGHRVGLTFSAVEIYNENIYDLLKKDKNKQALNLFTSGNEVQVKNLIWVNINSQEDIIKYTKEASDSRRSDSTQFNSTSSRSHAIFQIKIEYQGTNKSSIINIIDLAGSERSSLNFTGKSKEEIEISKRIQTEANFINKSLTTLGRIIGMIGDKKNTNNKLAIPYRESKLTQVLQVNIYSC
jgi:kinesin family protein C1